MHIIAITGSVAMGKSTTLAMLHRMHIPTFDADKIAAQSIAPGGPAARQYAHIFPQAHSREALWQILEKDPEARIQLEKMIHPFVWHALQKFIKYHKRQGRPVVAIDIPLLYEAGWEKVANSVWVISAPQFLQHRRLLKRHGMNLQRLQLLCSWQYPDFLKRRHADMVIHTGLGKAVVVRQIMTKLSKELRHA